MPTATRARLRTPGEIAGKIIESLEAAERELEQALRHSENLVTILEDSDPDLPRFRYAVEMEAHWVARYLGPEHAGCEFEVSLALRDARELQALVDAAEAGESV